MIGRSSALKIRKMALVLILVAFLVIGILWFRKRGPGAEAYQHSASKVVPNGSTWTFAVSGDSRNCGDVIVPTIAADITKHAPQFYWHLGDFRFIALVDEDMQCGPVHENPRPAHKMHEWKDMQELIDFEKREWKRVNEQLAYEEHAWDDFIHYQVRAFKVPVFLGIGNHEMILHHDHEDFIAAFKNWLNPDAQLAESGKINTYYHWTIGGVDFINLDNAGTDLSPQKLSFSNDQLKWFEDRLERNANNPEIKSVVVGMHAALPDSISRDHSMNESEEGTESGRRAYEDLWDWQTRTHKHVYVLASHSHYYAEDIFNTPAWKAKGEVLDGWIVGTAGAHRNPLPPDLWKNAKDARTNIYGYLLGTVNPDGAINFEFHEVQSSDVPSDVSGRFASGFVNWCFQKNTDCMDTNQHCVKDPHQPKYDYPAGIRPLHCGI
jgi:hypothetical protein